MESTLKLVASIDNLYKVNEFVQSCANTVGCSREALNSLLLVSEEIFVNVVNYAYDPEVTGMLQLVFDTPAQGIVTMKFIDEGKSFDPLKVPPPDIMAPLEERTEGGLGIFLAKQLVDAVQYERCKERNVLTITRRKS